MAFVKPFETEYGIVMPNAYHRVTEFFLSMEAKQVGMQVATYVDADTRFEGKKPIVVRPYEVFHNPNPKINAAWQVKVDGDGELIVNVEGKEYVFNTEEGLLEALQGSELAADFSAYDTEFGYIQIEAKDEGKYSGAQGAKVTVTGTGGVVAMLVINPQNEQPSDFDIYFGLDKANQEGMNPVKLCYEYLKTLPEFAGAIDVYEEE